MLGSNQGDKLENLKRAISILKEAGVKVRKISSVYQSAPWGYEEQEDFLNLAVEVESDLAPLELLGLLKEIERKMGRKRTFRWGPRIIDIDILIYDNLSFSHPQLIIPHPLLKERLFALLPLQEIAPNVLLPDGSSPFQEIEKLKREQKVVLFEKLEEGGES
ncbi:MAG: 2-amino-4-hydroxy-6-hydroxymethyldihydropteridine diphosphokinase [bacterium]